jgi:hypothetical protein
MKWINILNEMPSEQEQILVLINSQVASVAKFNGFDFTDDGLDVENVTHWCYLPKIPEQDMKLWLKI